MGRRSRFVPYDDIRDISVATFAPARRVLRVTLRDASAVTLNTRELATLLLRLRAAIEVHRRFGATTDVGARIREGGRSDDAWIADLAAMRNRGSEYRVGALPGDDLWRIMENPALPKTPVQRPRRCSESGTPMRCGARDERARSAEPRRSLRPRGSQRGLSRSSACIDHAGEDRDGYPFREVGRGGHVVRARRRVRLRCGGARRRRRRHRRWNESQ